MTTTTWYETYKAAVLETDWKKMDERIRAAESAIRERQHEFSLDHGGTAEERQEIADVLNALGVLRRDAIAWSHRYGSTDGQEPSSQRSR